MKFSIPNSRSAGKPAAPTLSIFAAIISAAATFTSAGAIAQEQLPWKDQPRAEQYDTYREVAPPDTGGGYEADRDGPPNYVPPRVQYNDGGYGDGSAYNRGPDVRDRDVYRDDYRPPQRAEPVPQRDYAPPRDYDRADYDRAPPPDALPPYREERAKPGTFSEDEILDAGHQFFGSISQGLASVVEKAFNEQGRPNGYILGEDAGGAFIAGLRYGEGVLYTRDAGRHRVYWQGPTVGYDFGAEGSKTMVLIYNLQYPSQIYQRFGGVQGSAYLVGGVSLQVMKRDDVTLAPIRSGVGLRLGANVGYLKYTRSPTWNPF